MHRRALGHHGDVMVGVLGECGCWDDDRGVVGGRRACQHLEGGNKKADALKKVFVLLHCWHLYRRPTVRDMFGKHERAFDVDVPPAADVVVLVGRERPIFSSGFSAVINYHLSAGADDIITERTKN